MIIQVIHLTEHDLTCARFRLTGKDQLAPLSGFQLPFTGPEELAAHLREQLPSPDPVAEVRTILALPPALVTLREMNLPITDRRKLRAVLPLELSGETALEDQDLVCDALPLADGTMLTGWASKEVVAQFIALFRDVGFEPEVVTLACMHWNILIPEEQDEVVALVDRQAILVGHNGRQAPIFCRCLGQDSVDLQRTLSALELTKSVTVHTIYSFDADLPFNPPPTCSVQTLPLPHQLTLHQATGALPALALAAPLATATAYCNGTIFNLRNGSLAWTKLKNQLLRRYRIPLVLTVVALLLLSVESGTRWYLLKRDLASINSSISKIYREVFPARKKAVDETAEIKAEIRKLHGGIASQSMLAFLTLLASSKTDQISGLSEVEYDGTRFRLKGDSRSSSEINLFRQRLGAAGWTVEQPEITTRPDGSVLFVLKGSQGGGAQ